MTAHPSTIEPASLAELAAELQQVGERAGLDAIGFCEAQPFVQARQALEHHQQMGWSAGMEFTYRRPDRSTDPRQSLPDAAALVVAARRYLRSEPDQAAPPGAGRRPQGRVARYSWVDHYTPLRQGLTAVARRLRAHGYRARVLADDNALVDRAAAVRSGLGWYGKNSNVLLPGAGSWFVLGSVLTDAPLVPGGRRAAIPVADGCGPCQRCLSSCPKGALVGPGQLDARRCLAWLLQATGPFPVEYREALGDRIYGCDDCQDVCPVNRLAQRTQPPPVEPEAQSHVDLLALLDGSDEEVLALVGRWYIPGRDARYVRRNALVVLGNTADPADPATAETLRRCLASDDPMIAGHAVWAAARLGRTDLLEGRTDLLDGEGPPLPLRQHPDVAAELAGVGAVRSRAARSQTTRSQPGRSQPAPTRAGAGS
jgi:epoxyqueuosine reductase